MDCERILNKKSSVESFKVYFSRPLGNVVRSYGIPFDTDASDVFLGESRDLGDWSELASFTVRWESSSKVEVEQKPFKFVVSPVLKPMTGRKASP